MANDVMPVAHVAGGRLLLFANLADLERTAGVEFAARRRVDRAWDSSAQADVGMRRVGVGAGDSRQQRGGVRMIGLLENRFAGTNLHDVTEVHHGDIVREEAHRTQVVRNQNHRGVLRLLDFQQQVQHRRLHRNIQRGNRLIADDHRGVGGNGAGNSHALFFAAAQLSGQTVVITLIQFDGAEQSLDLRLNLVGWDSPEAAQRKGNLVADSVGWIQHPVRILENHLQVADAVDAALAQSLGHIHIQEVDLSFVERFQARRLLSPSCFCRNPIRRRCRGCVRA